MKTAIPTSRFFLFGLLALPIGVAGTLAWTQHRAGTALRNSSVALAAENARLNRELASLDQRRTDVRRELSDAEAKRVAAEAALTPELRRRQAIRILTA